MTEPTDPMSARPVLTEDVIRAWRGILAFHPEGNDAKMVELCDSHEQLRAEVARLTQERETYQRDVRLAVAFDSAGKIRDAEIALRTKIAEAELEAEAMRAERDALQQRVPPQVVAPAPITSAAVCAWLRDHGYPEVAEAIELGEQLQETPND